MLPLVFIFSVFFNPKVFEFDFNFTWKASEGISCLPQILFVGALHRFPRQNVVVTFDTTDCGCTDRGPLPLFATFSRRHALVLRSH